MQRLALPRQAPASENHSEATRPNLPMNRQLYQVIRQAILQQVLPVGMQLPSSRELARELGLSRNTVMFAYEQLIAEGYIETRPGSGSFIADTAPSTSPQIDNKKPLPDALASEQVGLSQRGRHLMAQVGVSEQQWGAFMPGVPDVSHFPYKIWSRLHNKVWRRGRIDLLTYSQAGGYLPLRSAIAEYLRLARSVNCSAENVLITNGIHQSIDLIAKLLGDAKEKAWVEDPGYWGTRSVLHALDMETVPIPVDDEGMNFSAQLDMPAAGAPKLIFVTPSHQYPTGVTMSLARRRQLVQYAQDNSACVVEDDYDSEFRFGGRPLASLQGMDSAQRVLYMGTFSKTLFPGLRTGFLVVPPALADIFATALSELYRGGHLFTQAVLTDFMVEGHFASHVRRMRQLYSERRLRLQQEIQRHFGTRFSISGAEAGLHLALRLPDDCDDVALSQQALASGIIARPLSGYYLNSTPLAKRQRGLMLGYAYVPEEEIAPAFAKLAQVIERAIKK
ncbi:MAG: PLP-dependent aminotransferase family protein [Burkholderiales bacterium]|nr:PLP-dependent aminotransferase family protein [Burkholderiales bacterium]